MSWKNQMSPSGSSLKQNKFHGSVPVARHRSWDTKGSNLLMVNGLVLIAFQQLKMCKSLHKIWTNQIDPRGSFLKHNNSLGQCRRGPSQTMKCQRGNGVNVREKPNFSNQHVPHYLHMNRANQADPSGSGLKQTKLISQWKRVGGIKSFDPFLFAASFSFKGFFFPEKKGH